MSSSHQKYINATGNLNNFNNFGDFDRKPPIASQNYSERKNYNNTNLIQNKNKNNSFNNNLTPQMKKESTLERCNSIRENENQNNFVTHSRKNSSNKSYLQDNSSINQNNISKLSSISTVGQYLDRRHIESQERVNKMRIEKFQKEVSNYEFSPKISENSKKILERIAKEESVMHTRSKEKKMNKGNVSALIRNSSNEKLLTKRNNSSHNLKPQNNTKNNIPNNKMTRTIEELNDYKRIIEKRENMNTIHKVVKSYENNRLEFTNNVNNVHNLIRKRPSSTNPKQRTENNSNNSFSTKRILNNSNINTIITIEEKEIRKDDNDYHEYDKEKVIDSRLRLNNYLTENKNTNLNHNNNQNNSVNHKIISQVKNNYRKENSINSSKIPAKNNIPVQNNKYNFNPNFVNKIDNPIKIKQYEVIPEREKNKENYIIDYSNKNKEMPLPAENNNKIDFYQLDQFSPPNNNNPNIVYDIQKAYYKNEIINNNYATLNNKIKDNNLTFKRENSAKNLYNHSTIDHSANTKREDLNFFKNYVDNMKNNLMEDDYNSNNQRETIKKSDSNKKIMERNNSEKRINSSNYNVTGNFNNQNNQNNSSDQFKLDNHSKNYALEKLQEMKARSQMGYNENLNQNKIQVNPNSYRRK